MNTEPSNQPQPGDEPSSEARTQELANRVLTLALLQQFLTMPLVMLFSDMRLSGAAPNIQPAMIFSCLAMMAMSAMALGAPQFKAWATLKWLNTKPVLMGAFAMLCIGLAVLITQVIVPVALDRQEGFERRVVQAGHAAEAQSATSSADGSKSEALIKTHPLSAD